MDGGAEVKPKLVDEVVGTCTHVQSKHLQLCGINCIVMCAQLLVLITE